MNIYETLIKNNKILPEPPKMKLVLWQASALILAWENFKYNHTHSDPDKQPCPICMHMSNKTNCINHISNIYGETPTFSNCFARFDCVYAITLKNSDITKTEFIDLCDMRIKQLNYEFKRLKKELFDLCDKIAKESPVTINNFVYGEDYGI